MLPCFNAWGQCMPPYFIFPGKRVPVTFNPLEGGVEGTIFFYDGNRIHGYANILHVVCELFHPKPSTSEARRTPH